MVSLSCITSESVGVLLFTLHACCSQAFYSGFSLSVLLKQALQISTYFCPNMMMLDDDKLHPLLIVGMV